MTESRVCQETRESQVPQDTRHILEAWGLRWPEASGMPNQPARWPWCQGRGGKQEHEVPLGPMGSLGTLDPKDPLEMLVIPVKWDLLGQEDRRALQGSLVKTVKRENQETPERWDSLGQREQEDFPGHLGLLD